MRRTVLQRLPEAIETLTTGVGSAAAWLYPVLVAVMIVNVVLRYGLGRGFIELEELQWHLYAAAFLLGFAYTYAADEHVRVDLLHARFSRRTRAWIELLGSVLLLLPFAWITTISAFDFFWQSYQLGERSPMPSGLPWRFVIKGVLFAALGLLLLQAVATALRQVGILWPGEAEADGRGVGPSDVPEP